MVKLCGVAFWFRFQILPGERTDMLVGMGDIVDGCVIRIASG